MDLLTFLAATVVVVPLCKRVNISPVIAFLSSGFVLQQLGLFQDLHNTEKLSELGVLFLLFEMGLELSLDRLKALAKYAFGLGSLQVLLCTAFFTLFALPAGTGLGTLFLERAFDAPASLVSIRSVDEALVIGAALSLSSSAFVLQLLSDRGEMATKVGSATLGVLLFQDIAVVPLLVLLPLIEQSKTMDPGDTSMLSLVQMLGPTALTTTAGLGVLLLGGKYVLRNVFEVVAASRSSETFVALCLLTVTGISLLTQQMGLSDTMGAFLAGVLLSETTFRTQVEADIRPFKGLLLGLFFVTTGSSIDATILMSEAPVIASLVIGLVGVKTAVIAALGPQFGLSRNESIRMGFLLSQGGEFAFVVLSLARSLNLLVEDLNQVLIIVVVLSMGLTPALAELGIWTADTMDAKWGLPGGRGPPPPTTQQLGGCDLSDDLNLDQPVLICGFTSQSKILVNMLESPLATSEGTATPYLALDMDPARVRAGQEAGFRVLYADVTYPAVLQSPCIGQPRAVVVTYSSTGYCVKAVASIRDAFPNVPIYASARDFRQAAQLKEAGADNVVLATTQSGLALGSSLLTELGQTEGNIAYLRSSIEAAVTARISDTLAQGQATKKKKQQRQRQEASAQAGTSDSDWRDRVLRVLCAAREQLLAVATPASRGRDTEPPQARPGLSTRMVALPESVDIPAYYLAPEVPPEEAAAAEAALAAVEAEIEASAAEEGVEGGEEQGGVNGHGNGSARPAGEGVKADAEARRLVVAATSMDAE